MKLIQLTQGYFAQVDDEDFEELSKYNWYASIKPHTIYAYRSSRREDGTLTTIKMHRQILGLTIMSGPVDHADCNGLNNQKANIRQCTSAQNASNRGARSNTSSKFKGVSWHKGGRKWHAIITVNGNKRHIGLYQNEEDAARAYNRIAKEYHTEFTRYNEVNPVF